MRIKILLIVAVVTLISFSQSKEGLKEKINSLLSDPFFESTYIAVDVYDLTEREILYQRDHKKLMHPASNMKILTSAAGLLFLGPDYQFTTSIYYTGEIINQSLYGDIYVKGGGDPDFTSEDLFKLTDMIDSLGIKEITGNIYGDVSFIDSVFWGQGWMWDDDPSTNAPYLTALNINNNAIGVLLNNTAPGVKASVILNPNTNYVTVENKTLTTDAVPDTYFITRDWQNRQNKIIASGTVSNIITEGFIRDYRYISLFNPQLYFLTLFEEDLIKSGIKIKGGKEFKTVPANAVLINSIYRRYDSVIVNLNKESDNLSAEMALFALAAKGFDNPATSRNGIKMIDSMIAFAGLDPAVYRLVDGSGVSHYNLVTAELMLAVLKYFYYQQPELFTILYNSFPIAGVDGTLRRRMTGTKAENNVHAKTGTLSGVSCLSGYVTADNSNMLAFSILVQNHVRNTSAAINFQNEICRILAEYKGE